MSEDGDQAVRDILKGASVVYIGLFLELLIAFVAQVLAAWHLSVSGFGGLTAGTALLDIGAIVGGLGLASGLTRYLPRVDAGEKRVLATTSLVVTLVASVALGALVALNARFIAATVFRSPDVAVSIRIFGAAIPFAAVLNLAIGGIRGMERSLYRVYVKNLLHPIFRFVLVVGAVVYGLDQAGIAGAYAVPYVLSGGIALFLFYRALPHAKDAITFDSEAVIENDVVSEMTRYSLPFTISGVAGFVYRSLDIFLVLYFIGDAATGIYGVAYAAVSFMGMFSTAFNFLGSPIASKLESTGQVDEVMRMFTSVARWLTIVSICALVPLGVFATEFISIIYRAKYASGGLALTILAVGFAVKNVLSIHGPILESLGRSKTLSFNSAVAAVTNLVLNLVLIPRYGIEGAAVATALSFFLRDGLATVQVRLATGRSPISWRATGPFAVGAPLLAVFVTVVAPAVPTTILWLVGVTGLFGIVYVGTVLVAFGLSETEVMVVRSAEEQYGLELGPLDGLVRLLSNR